MALGLFARVASKYLGLNTGTNQRLLTPSGVRPHSTRVRLWNYVNSRVLRGSRSIHGAV